MRERCLARSARQESLSQRRELARGIIPVLFPEIRAIPDMLSGPVQFGFTKAGRNPMAGQPGRTMARYVVATSPERKGKIMGQDGRVVALSIAGPDGLPMTLADLPAPTTRRWVASRKAQ